ncbi:MAG: mechanosensitive ion channel [Deltaproteobacteria bacterium]|jgi:small-conductance mechanosensitive channel|nr:mechanosensitive ion channel [Deltaproteobacteria bacterium]
MIKKINLALIVFIFLIICTLVEALPVLAQEGQSAEGSANTNAAQSAAPAADTPNEAATTPDDDAATPDDDAATKNETATESPDSLAPTTEALPLPPRRPADPDESALEQLMRERSNDLLGIADDADKMLDEARSYALEFHILEESIETSLGNFLRLYQISKHPIEQDDILRQLTGLKIKMTRNMAPIENISSTLLKMQSELTSMQEAITQQHASTDSTPLEQSMSKNMALANAHLNLASTWVQALLSPGKAILVRLDDSISQIAADMPERWKEYYFTESTVFSSKVPSMETGSDSVFKWFSQLGGRTLFFYPQSSDDWLMAFFSLLRTAVFLGFFGFLLFRAAHKLPLNLEKPVKDAIKGPWIFITLGIAMLNSSDTVLGGTYLMFSFPGILFLIWGIADLSWRLRIAAIPALAGNISPLSRFFIPACLGVTILYADVPTGTTSVLWFLTMVVFLFKMKTVRKRENISSHKAFILERFAYSSSVYFSVISLAVAVLGYPRLAILVFTLLFALINILVLGNALMHLGSSMCAFVFNEDSHPIKYAIVNAFVVPGAFVIALFTALPWLQAVPGSNFLIETYSHKGYNIGAASFDLSKVLFIVVLFFLFRSLKNLATTSLKLLPEKLPLEAGVIPPLQMLSRYFIWIIFALIALMLLGVNFTNLAVIAGGLSVGIGFGLQNLFSNLVSGIMIIFGRTILVGDYIEVGGISGTVRSVAVRCTVVETASNAVVFIPNSSIMSGQFTNWTRNGRQVRKSITMNVQYGSDTTLVCKLLLEATKDDKRIVEEPAPAPMLNDFVVEFLQFQLYVTIIDIDLSSDVLSKLRFRVENLFTENNIKFSSPRVYVSLNPPMDDDSEDSDKHQTTLEKKKDDLKTD